MDRILYWLGLLWLPVYGLAHLWPRDKRLWLFGSTFGKRFTDNPRYLYLWLTARKETGIRCVWMSRNKEVVDFLSSKGLEACHTKSLKGALLALRAGVYIYDNYSKDINFPLSGGALKVNLWHGVGNKRINHDNLHDKVRHPKNLWERWTTFPRRMSDEKPSDYVLCTSEEMGRYFAKAFKSAPGHVICEGYPRCDALFDTGKELLGVMTASEEKLRAKIESLSSKGKRIVAYLPTFRASEKEFLHVMDMEAFDAYLGEKNYVFVVKPHPKSVIKEAFKGEEYKNIMVVNSDVDVYTYLGAADMLVTDYSSVYTDYMLLDRPVVAFCYDSDKYETESRDYFIDQRQYMPELVAVSMKELEECMDAAFEKDECRQARLVSRARMFDKPDGNSCERVYKRICRILTL
ncbi:MAG: CDP-glycerol glycerophosphotransferase family protein [Lachnospiraceae bacterium]|nr:CDP-glycerol glycerophosphotransferase family protein [Lachnospiraceae bacterium]